MRPRGGLQQHGRRIDVAGLADLRIDQRGAHRMNFHRLVAEQQEPRHVEIVDHHVAKQAAGRGDVADGRRAGIARQDRHEFDLAHFAVGQAAAQAREIRIEAAVEADHQRRAGFLDDSRGRPRCAGSTDRRAFRRTPPCRRERRARSNPHGWWWACRPGWRQRPNARRCRRGTRLRRRWRRRVPALRVACGSATATRRASG